MIFFTSDTHFGDDGIIKREKRPFKNNKQFTKKIIRIWNKQANKDDIIYVIGDFFNYNKTETTSWKKTLFLPKKFKAKIIVICGNNEDRIINQEFDGNFDKFRELLINNGFLDIKKEEYLSLGNQKFYLNHFPENKKDDYVNLFGHNHRSTGLWKPFGLNVDCDLNYFYLYSQEEILVLVKEKEKFWDNNPNNTIM